MLNYAVDESEKVTNLAVSQLITVTILGPNCLCCYLQYIDGYALRLIFSPCASALYGKNVLFLVLFVGAS